MKENDFIEDQLAHAGEADNLPPEVLKMDRCRVTSQSDIAEEEFLFRLSGTPCFPRCELTTVTGPAKSGKTFLTSMIMACCARRQVLEWERVSEAPLRVCWMDTEQSCMTTKRILTGRVAKLVGQEPFPDEQYFVLNTRCLSIAERVDMFHLAVSTYEPDILIIDGIADLLDDINNGAAVTDLVQQLLAEASGGHCNITAIIHLNRTGERLGLRGWLGSVLMQKSYDMFNCERLAPSQTLSASMTFSRHSSTERTLYYEIDEQGLPYTAKKPDIRQRGGDGKFTSRNDSLCQTAGSKADSFCQTYILRSGGDNWQWDLRRLFADGLGTAVTLSLNDLKRSVMSKANIRSARYYEKLFEEACAQRIVKTMLDRGGRVLAAMP